MTCSELGLEEAKPIDIINLPDDFTGKITVVEDNNETDKAYGIKREMATEVIYEFSKNKLKSITHIYPDTYPDAIVDVEAVKRGKF